MEPKQNNSLDPRVQRLDIQQADSAHPTLKEHEYWPTFEVFHQAKRGKHHVHVGSVHAPEPEMALVFAKEQFGRRQQCTNMWVVKTTEIFSFSYDDSDMFETVPEKIHREAAGYIIRGKIEQYKKRVANEQSK